MPWWGWIFCGGIATMLAIVCAMHQTDPARDHKDRPVVIVLGGIASIAAFICGGTGVVKFVIWWRQG
jgi:hypothetical protein